MGGIFESIMKLRYVCEICGRTWEKEHLAEECEKMHPSKENMIIESISFPLDSSKLAPGIIRIRFSERRGDFATYELKQYGFKGV